MSANGDSTRDWLLKKLLKASKVLAEQEKELQQVKNELMLIRANSEALGQIIQNQSGELQRLAEKADDLEFENQQLQRVPPIAPNLTVLQSSGCRTKELVVTSVASAHGKTTIRVGS